ncbi:MAG TPA: metalloregulator ArsR/SmtB family transcription factor [Abditibacteriaceae bacterium]|jgi:ArsR family transcriptional regulator
MELLKILRILGDTSRMRLLRLLYREELSVAELQEILGMGQSRISMQLAQLKQAGLVKVRRAGQKSLHRAVAPQGLHTLVEDVLERSGAEIVEAAHDDEGLSLVLRRRKNHLRAHFDELAGRFGRDHLPGRSWKAFCEMLLHLLPPLEIADLGAGEATVALLLAQRAKRVVAIDNSEKMVEYGRSLAQRNGLGNFKYYLGDMEELPLQANEVDLALMHQTLHHTLHPPVAVAEAFRVLRPGGRLIILDLLRHDHEAARDLYADVWLGFSQVELLQMLRAANFQNTDVSIVDRETSAPHFQTVLAVAQKPH